MLTEKKLLKPSFILDEPVIDSSFVSSVDIGRVNLLIVHFHLMFTLACTSLV